MKFGCGPFAPCPKPVASGDWLLHSRDLTRGFYVLLIVIILECFIWYRKEYCLRPLCAECAQHRRHKRTTHTYPVDGTNDRVPLCRAHYDARALKASTASDS